MSDIFPEVQNGLGKHMSELPEETLEYQLKVSSADVAIVVLAGLTPFAFYRCSGLPFLSII